MTITKILLIRYAEPDYPNNTLIKKGFVFLAVLSTIVATLMGNYTLKKITVSLYAAFGGISTLVTVILGVIFNNETIYMYHIIGFALIFICIIGVIFIDRKSN